MIGTEARSKVGQRVGTGKIIQCSSEGACNYFLLCCAERRAAAHLSKIHFRCDPLIHPKHKHGCSSATPSEPRWGRSVIK
jgi:hypothetical protein